MRSKAIFVAALFSGAWGVIFPTQAWGGLIFGPTARTQFENFQAVAGDTFIDFESVATGTNLTTQFAGVTFASISNVAGMPAGPFHVEVSGAFSGTDGNTIVGSPCDPGCVDDGRVTYEMVFDTPQRRAGLERIWNTFTRTQFYNASDTLLASHVNTVGTEFVGFIADGTVPAIDWVSRIQIDSISGLQVGYSDDLFFGTAISAFTVNSTADAVDAVPGDGSCNTASATCTLRAAIQESNALAGDDTITRPAGTYTLTKTGSGENAAATGDLDVSQTVTINGAGEGSTIIDGNDTDRIFEVTSSSATLELTDMTLQDGDTMGGDGGAISTSSGTVVLSDCTITSNIATSGGALGNSSGDWTLTNVTLSGNTANGGESGGAINSSSGSWTFDNCTISGNTITNGGGGAINTSSGTWNFTDTTISGNSVTNVTGDGGGIYGSAGTWTFDGCTISGNSAGTNTFNANGGGVDSSSSATWTFNNTTFSGNSAGDEGGGMAVTHGNASFNNCTFSGNSAAAAGGGGLYQGDSGTIDIENTIVANSPSGGDCDGVITSSGYNLDSDGTCGLSSTGDLSSVDPMLGGLTDNGGNTLTHALLTGSPAIDVGNNATCEATDQRGFSRPIDGDGDTIAVCDMGAYESQAAAGMTGDGNGDGKLGAADLSACAALLVTSNAVCDADSSGTVDQSDIIIIVTLIFSGS